MAENREHEPVRFEEPDLTNPANRHERSDVNVRAITRFGIGLVILCLLSGVLLLGLFRYFQNREAAEQPPPRALPPTDARRLPPDPRLQSTPILDLEAINHAEDEILNGYGWVDPANGTVRIPVNKAVELLAKRGLPSRQGAPIQSASEGVSVPTESHLSMKIQQPGGPLAGELTPTAPQPGAAQPQKPAAPRAGGAATPVGKQH